MTKLRTPDSPEDAMMQAIGFLGAEKIAQELSAVLSGRTFSTSLLRRWADPETDGNRVDVQAALAIDAMLARNGLPPVFHPVFDRACQVPLTAVVAEPASSPLAEAIKAAAGATKLLDDYHAKSADGLDWHEIVQLRAVAQDIMKRLARIVRSLVVKPKERK